MLGPATPAARSGPAKERSSRREEARLEEARAEARAKERRAKERRAKEARAAKPRATRARKTSGGGRIGCRMHGRDMARRTRIARMAPMRSGPRAEVALGRSPVPPSSSLGTEAAVTLAAAAPAERAAASGPATVTADRDRGAAREAIGTLGSAPTPGERRSRGRRRSPCAREPTPEGTPRMVGRPMHSSRLPTSSGRQCRQAARAGKQVGRRSPTFSGLLLREIGVPTTGRSARPRIGRTTATTRRARAKKRKRARKMKKKLARTTPKRSKGGTEGPTTPVKIGTTVAVSRRNSRSCWPRRTPSSPSPPEAAVRRNARAVAKGRRWPRRLRMASSRTWSGCRQSRQTRRAP
mmetsp:Transcript_171897/g.545759  ORF Transcript_171897/g.545759 Transcript_171897/m.545759 type:complete len:352 (+) Transcript_171897:443-1498(+)